MHTFTYERTNKHPYMNTDIHVHEYRYSHVRKHVPACMYDIYIHTYVQYLVTNKHTYMNADVHMCIHNVCMHV